jgi:hypothetical protein
MVRYGTARTAGRLRQELEHVALRERRHQGLLRVPASRVSAEGGICSPWDCQFGSASHIVIPGVRGVACGPLPKVPGPGHDHLIVMSLARHALSPSLLGLVVAMASAK